jgi:hypothetical protein
LGAVWLSTGLLIGLLIAVVDCAGFRRPIAVLEVEQTACCDSIDGHDLVPTHVARRSCRWPRRVRRSADVRGHRVARSLSSVVLSSTALVIS